MRNLVKPSDGHRVSKTPNAATNDNESTVPIFDVAHAKQIISDLESALRTLELAVGQIPTNKRSDLEGIKLSILLSVFKAHEMLGAALEPPQREANN